MGTDRSHRSFADGLRDLFTQGSLVVPVRLTDGMRDMINYLVDESLENTSVRFPDPEDEKRYDEFMQAMTFLKTVTQKNVRRDQRLSNEVARMLYFWITSDLKYHHRSDEPDFEKSRQWIVNFVSRQYAISEISI